LECFTGRWIFSDTWCSSAKSNHRAANAREDSHGPVAPTEDEGQGSGTRGQGLGAAAQAMQQTDGPESLRGVLCATKQSPPGPARLLDVLKTARNDSKDGPGVIHEATQRGRRKKGILIFVF